MTLVGSLADSLAPAASAAEGEHRARPVQGSWRDSASAVRDRLTASRTFQRWAARIPGVRWIARRRARQVFDLVAGFAYTQTVAACLRVGLLALLRDEPLDDAAIAQRLALPAEGIQRLLHAAAALGLVERRSGGRWGSASSAHRCSPTPGSPG
jgi:demethylspheroidene O-methyltransferase